MLHYNSTSNSRGVGILISSKLDCEILNTFRDASENILGLNVSFSGHRFLLASIYGPNLADNTFFQDLNILLNLYPDSHKILAGDWNMTFSTADTNDNIDIYRMAAPPSLIRSRALAEVCTSHHLSDPFRALHPDRRDFSFRPSNQRANRSRLDFFIISDNLINMVSSCCISTEIANSLFDHHYISLSFLTKKFVKKQSINPSVLIHPRVNEVIACAVVDSHLLHADQDANRGTDLAQGKLEVGICLDLLRQINEIELSISVDGETPLKIMDRERLIRELTLAKDILPTPEQLSTLILNCEDDIFFEILLSSIKGSLISFQSWLWKVSNSKKAALNSQINSLRDDFQINSARISELQAELNAMVDLEVREKIKSMKIFEGLHSEKPSPMFLCLAKSRNNGKLSQLRRDNGEKFASSEECSEHIVSFYEQLYKKSPNEDLDYTNVIENFLGEEIASSRLVTSSKLTPAERESLESPLTLEDLDNSLKKANFRSAPGADGFSNILIKKCWPYLRSPLLKYANSCRIKGELTANFKGATIKLIPKKSDLSSLKNWRPISLLSNLYKILSRAINERLNKVVNRICSRSQKGFNKLRYTQEVLINVWETVRKCKTNNINGGIMAIDMAKAFDTLSNKFLEEVLKFFGFGNNMLSWLKLLGTNRTACVMLEDGELTRNFLLERGRPQGDNISPNTFNFCIQILIFKLELDKSILPIPRPPSNLQPPINIPDFFMYETCYETTKNEGLADDNSSLVLLDINSLQSIKTALQDFGRISGLVCNYDKSVIMPFLDIDPDLTREIERLGFQLVTNFKLLGLELNNNLDNTQEIYETIAEKIRSLIRFWERFKLTLPGRIVIMKTCLISQINYIGCFLPAPENCVATLQSLIDSFVKQNLPVAADRLYLPPAQGGLGIFKINSLLSAQHCSWIRRARLLPIDNWREDLRSASPDNKIELIRESDINRNLNPILANFVKSYVNFYGEFTRQNNNYKMAYIYDNPAFTRNLNATRTIDHEFFGPETMLRSGNLIRSLTFFDCYTGDRMKTTAEFAESGIFLSAATWLRLQGALLTARNRYRNDDITQSACTTIDAFFNSIKRGSKKFRIILDRGSENLSNPTALRTVITFARLTDTVIPTVDCLTKCIGTWRFNWLSNDFRNFLYLLRTNGLMLNNRLNAFDQTVPVTCTFCRIIDRETAQRESFSHFFLDCPITNRLLSQWCLNFKPQVAPGHADFKKLYWYGVPPDDIQQTELIPVISDLFKYILWKYKVRKKIPNYPAFLEEYRFSISTMAAQNVRTRLTLLNHNFITNFFQAQG